MTQDAHVEWWQPVARSGRAGMAAAPTRNSAIPFAALVVFIVVLFLMPQAVVPGLGRVRLALLTGAFAIAAHSWVRFTARQPLMRFTPEVWLVVALLGWTIATFPFSQWLAGSMQIFFGEYLRALAVFWLLSNTVSTLGRLRTVAWALSLTAVPLAATGVWNFLSHNMVGGRIASYAAPLTTDPNNLAMVLNLILPLTVGLLLVSRPPIVRGFLTALVALDATAIVATFSRGGFLVLATTFVLYLRTLQRWGKWRWAVAALVLAVAAVPLAPPEYLDRLGTIGNIQGDETGSAQERWELTQAGLDYAISHPLVGAGLGMNVIAHCTLRRWSGIQAENCGRVCFETLALAGERRTKEQFFNTGSPPCMVVHNAYLQHAIDLGWLGLGLFLLLLVSCVRSAAHVRERCSTGLTAPTQPARPARAALQSHPPLGAAPALSELASLAEAVRIMIVAFAVAAFFYPWAYSLYLYCAVALAVAAGAVYEAEARSTAAALRSG